MRLYHGSNVAVKAPNLAKCKKYKDFGQGFYLTTIEEQAVDMAKRTVRANGGEPTVTCFEFDDSNLDELNVKRFESVSEEWALMVVNNRNERFIDLSSPLCNGDNKYDIVYGPVANDDVIGSMVLFVNGRYDIEQVKKRFVYKKYNNQYSFHTDKALKLLTYIYDEVANKTKDQEMIITYLTTEIIGYIAKDNNVSNEVAMAKFYSTSTAKRLEDLETGYYQQSASYLYEMIKEELEETKD